MEILHSPRNLLLWIAARSEFNELSPLASNQKMTIFSFKLKHRCCGVQSANDYGLELNKSKNSESLRFKLVAELASYCLTFTRITTGLIVLANKLLAITNCLLFIVQYQTRVAANSTQKLDPLTALAFAFALIFMAWDVKVDSTSILDTATFRSSRISSTTHSTSPMQWPSF